MNNIRKRKRIRRKIEDKLSEISCRKTPWKFSTKKIHSLNKKSFVSAHSIDRHVPRGRCFAEYWTHYCKINIVELMMNSRFINNLKAVIDNNSDFQILRIENYPLKFSMFFSFETTLSRRWKIGAILSKAVLINMWSLCSA